MTDAAQAGVALQAAPRTLEAVLDALAGVRCTVVGDAILDVYVRGSVARRAREGAVPVVAVQERESFAGGAANAALNAARLGAEVRLVSTLGPDEDGDRLLALLEGQGVDVSAVLRAPGRRTVRKTRVVAGGAWLLRIDEGTTDALEGADERRLERALARALAGADVALVSDYGGGTLTPAALAALGRPAAARPLLVGDGREIARLRAARPSVVTPSWEEAAALLGGVRAAGPARAGAVAAHAERLLALTGAALAAVTLDRDGAVLVERGRPPYRSVAPRALGGACTGAGDAFVATFALALAAGAGPVDAAELATVSATTAAEAGMTAAGSPVRLRDELERLRTERP